MTLVDRSTNTVGREPATDGRKIKRYQQPLTSLSQTNYERAELRPPPHLRKCETFVPVLCF